MLQKKNVLQINVRILKCLILYLKIKTELKNSIILVEIFLFILFLTNCESIFISDISLTITAAFN